MEIQTIKIILYLFLLVGFITASIGLFSESNSKREKIFTKIYCISSLIGVIGFIILKDILGR